VSAVAARIGSAAFLFPEIKISPCSLLPPVMRICHKLFCLYPFAAYAAGFRPLVIICPRCMTL
jgi:hypothetical protein